MQALSDNPDPLFSTERAGEYLGGDKPIPTRTLEDWRTSGIGPEFVRLGARAVRYRKSALDAFLERCARTSTAEG